MRVRRGWRDDSRGEPRGCIDIREWRMPFGWIRACACTILRDLRRNRRRLPRVVVSNSVRRGCCRAQPNVRGIPRNDTCRATSYVQPRGFYCPLPVSDLLLCIDQVARPGGLGRRTPEAVRSAKCWTYWIELGGRRFFVAPQTLGIRAVPTAFHRQSGSM